MPDADKRVFDYFASNEDTAEEVDYLAFASYAFAKFEWFEKFLVQNGVEPTRAEIDKWIAELPDSRLKEIHDNASRVFRNAARLYMDDRVKLAEAKAVSASIRDEVKRHNEVLEGYVRRATSFKDNLPANIGVGILSSVIFSVVIIVASLIFTKDPSPIALYKSFGPSDTAPHPAPLPPTPRLTPPAVPTTPLPPAKGS